MKIISILMACVAVAVISPSALAQEVNMSQFEHLKEPKISNIKNQKMLVVEAKGNPNVVGGKAFGLLFGMYYQIEGVTKGAGQPAPRARWPVSSDVSKSEWVGFYALPVHKNVSELPQHRAEPGFNVSLTTWEYGEVAEILHIGPYDKEEPTTKRLMGFVKKQGYVTIGEHEEEYIKGPTMYSKGDPEKYITIIRYRVKKKDEP